MVQDAVPHLPGEIQACAGLFEAIHHANTLLVVTEATLDALVQTPLSGVSEGGVAQIVSQRDGLGQIFVEPQGTGDSAGDLRHLQGVGQTGTVVVALRSQKHLRFMLETAKRLAMQHPIPIPLIDGAIVGLGLRPLTAATFGGQRRIGRQYLPFDLLPRKCSIIRHSKPSF